MKTSLKISSLALLAAISMILISCKIAPPVFENKTPAFSIELPTSSTKYPDGWIDQPLQKGEFLRIATGDYKVPVMTVGKSEMAASPEEYAKSLCEGLKKDSQAQSCDILYAKAIKLADGTPAFEAEVKWKHPLVFLNTYGFVAKKGDVTLSASMTDFAKVPEALKKLLSTLKIK